jgi:hypothetical protein
LEVSAAPADGGGDLAAASARDPDMTVFATIASASSSSPNDGSGGIENGGRTR